MIENLHGTLGIITGAAQGLGYAIAKRYAEIGMRLAIMDVQAEKLHAVADELSVLGSECVAYPVDLADAGATQTAIDEVLDAHGTPQVLIHNAALLNLVPFSEMTLDEWQRINNIALQSGFILSKAVWPLMIAAGQGSIVYVSSRSGIEGFVGESVYCASKHGLEGLMKCLAIEGKPYNIAVNTITPGMYMHTPMSEQNYTDDLKTKWVDPYEMTPAYVLLAQQDASGITGQRLDSWALSKQHDA